MEKKQCKKVTDEEISTLELTRVMCEIRECQRLCRRSQNSTLCGSFSQFCEAREIMNRVERTQPHEGQQILVKQMHKLIKTTDDKLVDRILDHVDNLYPEFALSQK